MKTYKLIIIGLILSFGVIVRAEISVDKKQEIEKMLRLVGMEKLMDQMVLQMITSLRTSMTEVPDEFWGKFQARMNARELLDKIIPLYDKYYTLEDLRAVNAFYSSPAGQKVLSTLPQIMQESMQVGQEWGREIGERAAKEAAEEIKKSKTK